MKLPIKRKIFTKRKLMIGASLLTLVLGVGCYNVTYEILQVTTLASSAKKVFQSLGEVTHYSKNNGRLIIKDNQDTDENLESLANNNGIRIPTSVLIPADSVLPNGKRVGSQGRLVAVGDARWTGTSDLPQKASAWVRYSDDGGENWSKPDFAIHYDDFDMAQVNRALYEGVTTGDPTIGRTASNRLIMLSTFGSTLTGAWTGIWAPSKDNGNGIEKFGDAYFQMGATTTDSWDPDAPYYLRLRKNTKEYFTRDDTTLEAMTDPEHDGVYTAPTPDGFVDTSDWRSEEYDANDPVYCYYVPVRGGEIKKASGNGTCDVNDPGTGIFVDEYYYLYLDKTLETPLMVSQLKYNSNKVQLNGDEKVHAHLFMGMSPYQVWRGSNFIGMSYSDDGGITWSKHRDITYMVRPKEHAGRNTKVFFVSPAGGYLHDGMSEEVAKNQGENNRLLFSAYCGGTSYPVVFWTDDNGETWRHATDGGNGDEYISQSGSETTIVGHPDGALIAISRYLRWAVSLDGGVTWTPKGDLSNIGLSGLNDNNLMSAVVLDWTTNTAGDTLIAMSAANTPKSRQNGYVHIIAIEPDGGGSYTLNPLWNGTEVKVQINPTDYAYTSVCELANGNLAVFWEGTNSDYMLSFVEVQHSN